MSPAVLRLPASVAQLAKLCGGRVAGGDGAHQITGFATLADAGASELAFFRAARGNRAELAASRAGAVVVAKDELSERAGLRIVVDQDPRTAFVRIVAGCAHGGRALAAHRDARAVVDPSATIAADAHLGANVVVGPRAVVGAGSKVMANAVIAAGCVIGDGCWLHEGCVIGSEGFGFAADATSGRHLRFPHLGAVRLGDEVEIGANSCVDRGALGDTIIGSGTKVDNLVQIGHNVVIGERVIICGRVAIGGSAAIGDDCMLGGLVGVADHVTIAARTQVMAATPVIADIRAPGVYGGMVPQLPRQGLRKLWRHWLRLAKD